MGEPEREKKLRWYWHEVGFCKVWNFESNGESRVIRVRSDYRRLYRLAIAPGVWFRVGYYPEGSQGSFKLSVELEELFW